MFRPVDDGLNDSYGSMAKRHSFLRITKSGNPALRLTRGGTAGIRVTRNDLVDDIASSFIDKQNENNIDKGMKRDDLDGQYGPRFHMLRVRKSYPRFRQGMKLRVTRGEEKPLRRYFARI